MPDVSVQERVPGELAARATGLATCSVSWVQPAGAVASLTLDGVVQSPPYLTDATSEIEAFGPDAPTLVRREVGLQVDGRVGHNIYVAVALEDGAAHTKLMQWDSTPLWYDALFFPLTEEERTAACAGTVREALHSVLSVDAGRSASWALYVRGTHTVDAEVAATLAALADFVDAHPMRSLGGLPAAAPYRTYALLGQLAADEVLGGTYGDAASLTGTRDAQRASLAAAWGANIGQFDAMCGNITAWTAQHVRFMRTAQRMMVAAPTAGDGAAAAAAAVFAAAMAVVTGNPDPN